MLDPRASDEQLRLLIEHVGDAILLLDPAGRVLTWNPAAETLFGHTPSEALELDFAALAAGETPHADTAELLRDAEARGRIEREGWYATRGGRRLWAAVVISPIRAANGDLRGFAQIIRDKTALRDAEELLAARTAELERSNQELQAFASIASHDLQEPLRKIRVFADRVARRWGAALPTEGVATVAQIEAAASRMQRLIDSILEYASLSRMPRTFEPIDLGAVARQVQSDFAPRVEEVGGTIDVQTLPTIEAVPSQMHQLLQNLVGNALKFVRTGIPPHITITSEPLGDRWRLRVSDNGIGFAPHHGERIFGILQRLHPRHEYEGTGIGLAICRRIVEQHHGTITAQGRPGSGAVFTIDLPARQEGAG